AVAEAAAAPAVVGLRMQGEHWWRIAVGYAGRSALRTLAADAGVRLTGVLYLVATAAFLGVGAAPDAADWAVMVDRNRTGMFVQPWAVALPAALIMALTMGTNLLCDAALGSGGARRRGRADRAARPDRPPGSDRPDRSPRPDHASGPSHPASRADHLPGPRLDHLSAPRPDHLPATDDATAAPGTGRTEKSSP
ncbi:hypothetical protein ACI2LU_33110, partial [Streptomyces angustmyceticus]